MDKLRLAKLALILFATLPVGPKALWGGELDSSECTKWGNLLTALAPFKDSADSRSRDYCVAACTVVQTIPEIDPIRIRRIHLLVKVDYILKPFEPKRENERDETQEEFMEKRDLEVGDTICVTLPIDFKSIERIGAKISSIPFILRRGKNRRKQIAETTKEVFLAENPAEVSEDRLAEAIKRSITKFGLAAVPEDAKWWEFYDAGLTKSTGWDLTFCSIEYETDLLDMNSSLRTQFDERINGMTYPKGAESVRSKAQVVPCSEVKIAAAEYFLQNGDSHGVCLYIHAVQHLVGVCTFYTKMAANSACYSEPLSRIRKAKQDLMLSYLQNAITRLRLVLVNHELPDPALGLDTQELQAWCSRMAKAEVVRETEHNKFRLKLTGP